MDLPRQVAGQGRPGQRYGTRRPQIIRALAHWSQAGAKITSRDRGLVQSNIR